MPGGHHDPDNVAADEAGAAGDKDFHLERTNLVMVSAM